MSSEKIIVKMFPQAAAAPRLPKETGRPNRKETPMYALEDPETGHRVPPVDDDGTGVFLCWPTLEEAIKGKKYQEEYYDLEGYEIVELAGEVSDNCR